MKMNRHILLVAGGSGGHIFPAIALHFELRKRGWKTSFITDSRGFSFVKNTKDLAIFQIKSASPSGKLSQKLKGLLSLSVGLIQAIALLRRLKPSLIIGFGGYATIPSILGAALLGYPSLVHEQNAVLGRANRLLARLVLKVATSFTETFGVSPSRQQKLTFTGNPVRGEFFLLADHEPASPPSILVMGGSQGAEIFSDVVPQAIMNLPNELRKNLFIYQQCREKDLDRVREAYTNVGIKSEITTFFGTVPRLMARASLVISRAGASTLSELSAVGRAAILVPYPHASDDHQMANALDFIRLGGGWIIQEKDFCAEALTSQLCNCFSSNSTLAEAGKKARQIGCPDATQRLADLAVSIACSSPRQSI